VCFLFFVFFPLVFDLLGVEKFQIKAESGSRCGLFDAFWLWILLSFAFLGLPLA
jgi:hypothetical protein